MNSNIIIKSSIIFLIKKYTILLYVRNIRILTYFCKKKKNCVKINNNNNNWKIIIVNSILFKMINN